MTTRKVGVTGAKEIAAVLDQLPKQLQKRALYNAFKAGAEDVAEQARQNARRHGMEDFARNIKTGRPTKSQKGAQFNPVGKQTVAVVALKKGKYSRLAHLFEYGTKDRFKNTNGAPTGRIMAQPFLRPALDTAGEKAIKTIADRLKDNVRVIARQLARNQKVSLTAKARRDTLSD